MKKTLWEGLVKRWRVCYPNQDDGETNEEYQIMYDVRNMKRLPCETWGDLKREMRDRFLPSYYARDLFVKLQKLFQGYKSIEEYHKEIKICMIRAQIMELQEAIMARFLHRLNRDIQDIVELHHYSSIEDLVHQATKVESQLNRKLSSRKSYPNASWKGKGHISSQCPNRRTTVFRDNGEVDKSSTQEDTSSSSSRRESSSEASHYKGELFMVRRLMSSLVGKEAES
ncbi:hypothetical protein CR513_16222, partial [Mucuna pruriens]